MTQKFKVLALNSNLENTKKLLAREGYKIQNLTPEKLLVIGKTGKIKTTKAFLDKINIEQTTEILGGCDVVIHSRQIIDLRRIVCRKESIDPTNEELVIKELKQFLILLWSSYLNNEKEIAETTIEVFSV